MKKLAGLLIIFGVYACLPAAIHAQCDTVANLCEKHITADFVSDGQQYRSLLIDEEVAEFHATFFGESTYRIAACSGLTDGNIIFTLYDKDRNIIFQNSRYKNAPYWDFEFANSMDCVVEAKLDPISKTSGCAVLLIGFKQ
ncbi:MAG: hypothetical protein HYY40_14775 [Bacteroidetes bacterium]|nr:hypothetical protein [Bacteroidota bacterium]